MNNRTVYSMIQAFMAAILFGASAPIAKKLLGEIEPVTLAGLLYVGSGIGLLLFRSLRYVKSDAPKIEAELDKGDIKWLIGAILSGGVAAPIVLMFSLRNTPAASASLLLNFEGVSTTIIAALVFKEAVERRIWLAVVFITVASILLSLNFKGEWGISLGSIGIICACILWGIDNNFTRNISSKDPIIIVTIKGLGAGSFTLLIAFLLHNSLPDFKIILGAMLLGCFSYGLSIVLCILAMRNLGAARTSALFGTAPFAGALLSFILFQEIPDMIFFISILVMALGAILLLSENHGHEHFHNRLEHTHRHSHNDQHHTHKHDSSENGSDIQHSHFHIHEAVNHLHKHAPDIHHRHAH